MTRIAKTPCASVRVRVSAAQPFVTLEEVLDIIRNGNDITCRRARVADAVTRRSAREDRAGLKHVAKAVFENRIPRYMFGSRNYGDIPSLPPNVSDGDPWDVFAPGYKYRLPVGVEYTIMAVVGVFHLRNGNDKIAIRVQKAGYDPRRAEREVARYCKRYSAYTGVPGHFEVLDGYESSMFVRRASRTSENR